MVQAAVDDEGCANNTDRCTDVEADVCEANFSWAALRQQAEIMHAQKSHQRGAKSIAESLQTR